MATAHTGRLYNANIKGARVEELVAVNEGLLFSNAEAFKLGVRENVQISVEAVNNTDGMARGITDRRLASISSSSLQPTIAFVNNAYLLGKALNQVRVKLADGYYITFNETAGTEYLGLSWFYEIDMNKAICGVNWKGRVSLAKAETLESVSTAAHTGETGGSTLGLAASAYARGSYVPGNFRSMQVQNSDGTSLIGAFKELRFRIESIGDEDHMERPVHRKYKWTLNGIGHQTLKADRLAWLTDEQEDTTVILTQTNAKTIKINKCALYTKFLDGDENRRVEFEATGEIPANADDAVPTSIDLGITSATQIEISHLGAS